MNAMFLEVREGLKKNYLQRAHTYTLVKSWANRVITLTLSNLAGKAGQGEAEHADMWHITWNFPTML
jgi:hypothetical protein